MLLHIRANRFLTFCGIRIQAGTHYVLAAELEAGQSLCFPCAVRCSAALNWELVGVRSIDYAS